MAEFHVVHGRASSLVLEAVPGGAPLWRYWGPRLPDGTHPEAALGETRPLPTFALDRDVALSVFPLIGEGWFGQSALLAHRAGADWAQGVTAAEVRREGEALAVRLTDAVAGLEAEVRIALDPETDVLTCSTRLTNTGVGLLDVQWLAAATLPLPPETRRMHFYNGRHQAEFGPQTQELTRSLWRRENRRGLTSHDAPPTGFAETGAGHVYAAHLAWSGNSVQQAEWLDDGRYLWQFGEWLAPGEVRLRPREAVQTPELIATFSAEGRNGAMQNFHAAIRKRMTWPGGAMRPRPVQINTWEGFYFNHDMAGMTALADEAARLGIERFVLDDGWFEGRKDDKAALGDWTPDKAKYPDGLEPLAAHVTSLGMEFGLWVEPEMINPDSELARAHPEWILTGAGRPILTGRNQMLLDLTQTGVTEYLYDVLAGLLRSLPISYIKWDHNREIVAGGPRANYRRQVQSTYALMGRLRMDFPDVEIEACAAGGGRIDAGILQYTHRFWTSDSLDAVQRVAMQREFLRVFPPEVMGSHVGTAPAHSTRRRQSLDFRAGVALAGHFGVELDPLKLDAKDKARLADWIETHKALRDRLHSGRVWLGEAGDGVVWQAHGEARDLVLLLYRVEPTAQRHMPLVRLPMLEDRPYTVTRLDHTRTYQTASLVEAMRNGVGVSGAWLRESGLTMPAISAETVAIFRIVAR
ncbi:MAG: alpha-galactosidase [Hyphomonas sp.]